MLCFMKKTKLALNTTRVCKFCIQICHDSMDCTRKFYYFDIIIKLHCFIQT